MTHTQDWFTHWFDSPYYHLLYQHRDTGEAERFLTNLLGHLNPTPECNIMDLACGKGRHAIFMNKMGYHITGLDLSTENIAEATKQANEHLHFAVHDMRQTYRTNYFHYAFNLFTSFGYFDNEADDAQVIQAVYESLVPGGFFILDFLNVPHVLQHLEPETEQTIDGIRFHLTKSVNEQFIEKDIRFSDQEQDFHFKERVRAYQLPDFERLLKKLNFNLHQTFGDYQLGPYLSQSSERLILVAQKPHA